jgi:hypothetical protein
MTQFPMQVSHAVELATDAASAGASGLTSALARTCGPDAVLRAGALLWRALVLGVGLALASGAAVVVSPTRGICQTCVGDCDDNDSVTVAEIVTGVGIALGSKSLDQCPSFDCDGIGRLTIDCLVKAVNASLNGCAPEASNTPNPTASPTPTRTPTSTSALETATSTPTQTVTPPSCGTFLTIWGSLGSDAGQFNFPDGVTVDGNGNVLVVDGGNNRVEKFTNGGAFVASFGSEGMDDGQFVAPSDIAVDAEGDIFVTDARTFFNGPTISRIQKFNSAGMFLGKWGSLGNGDGEFGGTTGVAVDADGNVLVADRTNSRIQKFTSDGTFLGKWGTVGNGDGQFANPFGVAVDADGNVFVTDFFNDRIQKFTSDGVFLIKWGSRGSEPGQLSGPMGIDVDRDGDVFVVDDGNDRIQKFTGDGDFLASWGSLGFDDGQFNSPVGVAVDAQGNVFVSDQSHHMQKFACP